MQKVKRKLNVVFFSIFFLSFLLQIFKLNFSQLEAKVNISDEQRIKRITTKPRTPNRILIQLQIFSSLIIFLIHYLQPQLTPPKILQHTSIKWSINSMNNVKLENNLRTVNVKYY